MFHLPEKVKNVNNQVL